MAWELKKDSPIYIQLLDIIRLKIITGEYPKGSKLKSVRDLAAEAAVNPNTMQKALAELERTGLVITERTMGRNITEDDDLIKKVREDIATERIDNFVKAMNELGIEKKEIIEILGRN